MRRWYAVSVQSRGDAGECQSASTLGLYAFGDICRDARWASELYAGGPLHGERFLRPLSDQPPLELAERRHYACHGLSCWRRGVDGAVERHERPAFPASLLHEAREV